MVAVIKRMSVWMLLTCNVSFVSGQKVRTFETDYSEACSQDVFSMVEKMPEYRGGLEQLRYDLEGIIPKEVRVGGLYYVNINVNCKGKAYGFQVYKGTTDEGNHILTSNLEKLQNWIPGQHKGQPVDCMKLIKVSVDARKILVGDTR